MLERPYPGWLEDSQPNQEALEEQRRWSRGRDRKISILVPAYETPPEFLCQMAESVCAQTYENWELCIADGSASSRVERAIAPYREKEPRIRYQRLKGNLGISQNTNAALAMATGEYVGLLDHDDLLFPQTLYEVARAMEEHPGGQAFYTDEDKVSFDLRRHFQPHFKPDFNLELLRSNNYICHFFVVNRKLALEAGGFLEKFDGAQDYDFIFRCVERAEEVVHIPQILYSWRSHASSTAANPESKLYAYEAGKRAVQAHLKRRGVKAQVQDTGNYGFYRIRYHLDREELGGWENTESAILRNSFEKWNGQNGIKVVYYGKTCNKIVTFQQKITAGDAPSGFIFFTCVKKGRPDKEFLREMVSTCQRAEVGIVCARVYGRDGRLAHPVEMAGVEEPFHRTVKGLKKGYLGYFHRACLQQEVKQATDCFLMREGLFAEAAAELLEGQEGGEGQAFVPVDRLVEKVRQKGYRIVYNPWAVLYEGK